MYIDSAEQLKVVFKQMTGTYYRRTVPILIGSVDNHRARQEMEKGSVRRLLVSGSMRQMNFTLARL